MYLNLNCSTIAIGGFESMVELTAFAHRHGFEGVDLPDFAIASDAAADAARAATEGANVRVSLFRLPGQFLDGSDADFDLAMTKVPDIARRAARAGATLTYQHLLPGSDTLDYAANFARHVKRLTQLRDALNPHGVHVGLEFIGGTEKRLSKKYPYIYTMWEALKLADAVGPEIGLVIDAYHWWTSGGTLDDLRRLPDVGRIINVHLSDGVAGRPIDQQLDLERAMPGETGLVDLRNFCKVLRDRGYDGPVICEPFRPATTRFSQMPRDAVAQEVVAAMRPLL